MGFYDELLKDSIEKSNQQDVPGIVTAIVKENYEDKHKGMVKVEYIMGEKGKKLSEWVRVMVPYAGKGFGQYWLPEVGSEVVIAFVLGDKNCPIVLGGVWNEKDILPEKAAEKQNTKKLFKTKGGSQILFDDTKDKEKIIIQTPKEMVVEMDVEKDTISLKTQKKKVSVLLDGKNGKLVLDAEKEISLKVGGKEAVKIEKQAVKVDSGTIELKASQALKESGQTTEIKGSSTTIKSSGPLTVQSSAVTQIKGSLVKIN